MIDPLALFAIGVYLYYREDAKSHKLSPFIAEGKYPGKIDELLDRGHQWFEDPLFFLKKQ